MKYLFALFISLTLAFVVIRAEAPFTEVQKLKAEKYTLQLKLLQTQCNSEASRINNEQVILNKEVCGEDKPDWKTNTCASAAKTK